MKKVIALALSVLMMTSVLAGCGDKDKPGGAGTSGSVSGGTSGSQGAANQDPIKIGSIQDTSGGASLAGQPNQWGVEYAVRWINENGGINGRPVELYSRDCQNDAEVGVTNYRELVDEVGVCAIIGPPLSNPASAWVELATEDKVPIVGHFMDEVCTTDPDTGEAYPYMFLAEPSCAVQSYILAEYGMKELGVKTIATLYNTSNAYAVAHEGPFVSYVESNGGSVLARETFGWTDTDYTAQAQKIAALNPDAVLLCDYCNQMVTAYDNLRDAGYTGYILGANTMYPPFNTLVKNKITDCYFVQNYDLSTGTIAELLEIQMQETGTDYPTSNVGFGWDACMVLFNAMKQAKDPTDGEEVRQILENSTKDVESAGGAKITIDPAIHRPTRDMGMYIATYDADVNVDCLVYMTSDYNS
ncbi:ABC transporter substrate-binding protein [Colidextribacter sp. OB.20]|uniref:ABC transporter substrate-binding protein n=1 Tax=Colidextribacter sp. OB.20 TaxID=2304568 RepID=UPI001371E6CF|nr:ABC transporter substrate-binding protein [Colidextribacter sp. OB.20]NBI11776.1 ABC transporter substrate-binding protein [Colidextribacter sp. OB.20]